MPHQPVEDGRRALRAPARRAGRPAAPLSAAAGSGGPRGTLFVVTGPSGAGKGTLIRKLAERRPDLDVAVSATTRARREGETDGRDYHFLSEAEFAERVARDEFLEHVTYVSGHRYGTLRAEIDEIVGRGNGCVLELETVGARRVKELLPETVTVFVAPPSFAELERRLRARATESAGEIEERLELARRQTDEAGDFDRVVVNDDVERAVAELEELVDEALHGEPARTPGAAPR